jgi:AcrR family transcriptional regulator
MTLDAVIAAAAELGLNRIEMTAVAERLGIGVATLYGYVESREHLVRLVAEHCSRREIVADRGQSWQDVLREHAATSFKIYQAHPHLIEQMLHAAVITHVEGGVMDGLLSVLIARGIRPADALSLYYEVNQIVVGAAVGLAYRRALETRLGGYATMIAAVLDGTTANELPALRACADAGEPASLGAYEPTLERVLAAHEMRMRKAAKV